MLFRLKSLKHVEVISVEGRLEGSGVVEFDQLIRGLLERNRKKLVLDFDKLAYVNSGGLRAMLGALKECRKGGGNVVLCNVQPRVVDTLQLVGFQTLFVQYPDLLDAIDSF